MLFVTTNIMIVALLLLYLRKQSSVSNYIIAIIIYLSLHYAFAIVMAFVIGHNIDNIAFHTTGVPLPIKMVGLVFLFFCVLMILYKVKNQLYLVVMKHKYIFFMFTFFILACLLASAWHGYFLETEVINRSSLMFIHNHTYVTVGVWVLALFIAFSLMASQARLLKYKADIIKLVLTLVIIQVVFGVYELATGHSFATTASSHRAAGTLFNSNVLGIWAAAITLIVSYLYYMKHIKLRMLVFSFIMCSLLFVLCGSRSGLLACLVGMFVALILISTDKENNKMLLRYKILPIGLMLASLLSVISIAKVMVFFVKTRMLINSLSENADRFIYLVPDLLTYLVKKLSNYFNINLDRVLFFVNKGHEREDINQVMAGRLSAAGINIDNTYIYYQAISGWLSFLVFMFILGFTCWLGIRKYIQSPDLTSVYTLSFMSVLIFSGISMRTFQMFPLWIFFAVFLGISLHWWLDLKHERNLSN
jgi:hypothetical protein